MEFKERVSGRSIVTAREQVSSDLGGEVVILNLKTGIYYGLDNVGAHVWTLLKEPRRVNEIRDSILREYEVEPERCEEDLLALLEELESKGLIEISDEKAP